MKNTSEYLRKTHNSKIAGFALSLFGATVCWGEVVPLTANWEIYDPQGKSSVSNTSPSGFDANIFDLIDGDPSDERISVYQEFDPLDLTEVGTSIRARFDVEVLTDVYKANDSDFRFSFYDTSTNYEFILGMIDFGQIGGSAMRMRIDHHISSYDENGNPINFVTGDYGHLTEGGGTLASGGSPSAAGFTGLRDIGVVNQFETSITRISSTELLLSTTWIDPVSGASSNIQAIVNEAAPNNADDIPPSGAFDEVNGFGFRLNDHFPFTDNDPETTEDNGSYRVSNLVIDRCKIIENPSSWILYDPEGNSSLTMQSSEGFTVDIAEVANEASIPAVVQELSPLDISTVGQSVEASFDVTPLTEIYDINDADLRFGFFDTTTNFEILLGMVDVGPPSAPVMRIQIDDNVSSFDSENPPGSFVPGDFADFALADGDLAANDLTMPDPGFQYATETSRFHTRITRISATELEFETTWSFNVGPTIYTETATAILDESNPTNTDDVPSSGGFSQLNGFGFRITDVDPFFDSFTPETTSGTIQVANLEIRYCDAPSQAPEIIEILGITRNSGSGDYVIEWVSEESSTYEIYKSQDLQGFAGPPVATVLATGSTASHTIPASEVASDGRAFFIIKKP